MGGRVSGDYRTAKKILEQALSLPEEERQTVIEALADSLGGAQASSSDEWNDEIARRIEAVERGDSKLIEGDEVDARLRAALRRAG